MKDYCSLHNHTTYSMMDSIIHPEDLFKQAKVLEQSSIAMTDHGTLAGAWDGLQYSKKHGVKLIMGGEFYFTDNLDNKESRLRHVILLAKNHIGYRNLMLMNKIANDNAILAFKRVIPRINWEILEKYSEGLICTTACGNGILSALINTRRSDKAKQDAKKLKDIFGDNLALEVQPNALKRNKTLYNDYEDQLFVNNTLINFGKELDIKVIAATDAHYLTKDNWESHDTWLAIGTRMPVSAISRLKYPVHDFYMKSRDEVVAFFSRYYSNAEEFCDNTLYFAGLCEEPDWIDPKFSNPTGKELPTFPVKDQKDYAEYKVWLSGSNKKTQELAEDESYLLYWCGKEFSKKGSGW